MYLPPSALPKFSCKLISLVMPTRFAQPFLSHSFSCSDSSEISTKLLACSPEGLIRFWPQVSSPENFLERNLGLQQNELCSHVTSVTQDCFVVATSLGKLLVVTQSQYGLTLSDIGGSSGWNFGFRMLGFNGSQADRVTRSLISGNDQTPG